MFRGIQSVFNKNRTRWLGLVENGYEYDSTTNVRQEHAQVRTSAKQCFFFSRNIGQVTPKVIYFYYLEIKFWIKVSKNVLFILKTEALVLSPCDVSEMR